MTSLFYLQSTNLPNLHDFFVNCHFVQIRGVWGAASSVGVIQVIMITLDSESEQLEHRDSGLPVPGVQWKYTSSMRTSSDSADPAGSPHWQEESALHTYQRG